MTPPRDRPLRVYLASRYERMNELAEYARSLRARGLVVTSRWLDGENSTLDTPGAFEQHATHPHGLAWAAESATHDLDDVRDADLFVVFTEPAGVAVRGGCHVELGAALALGKHIFVVGFRSTIFHHLPHVRFTHRWEDSVEWGEGR